MQSVVQNKISCSNLNIFFVIFSLGEDIQIPAKVITEKQGECFIILHNFGLGKCSGIYCAQCPS